MTEHQGRRRPRHELRYTITDEEARAFLQELAEEGSQLRTDLTERPREVLLDLRLDIKGIPETIDLPPADEIGGFIEQYLGGETKTDNLGYAILYWILGAMPVVVAEDDGPG